MMMKSTLAFTLLATLAAAGTAAAGGRDGHFSRIDKDGDGKVAVSELDAHHREFLGKADADKDGFITREEMQALHEARKGERDARRFPDANKNGVVDRREFEDAARARFDEIDRNGDGLISRDELPEHRRGMRHHEDDED
jgi:Ca2+-binding EF-hand superfamily protein